MVESKNPGDVILIKDKIKGCVYVVFGVFLFAITISLLYNLVTLDHKSKSKVEENEMKQVQIVKKETEKNVKGKLEKTKEIQTTEKADNGPKGFQEYAVDLLKQETVGTVLLKHFFMYIGALVLYLLFIVTSKGVNSVKVPGLEIGAQQEIQSEFAKAIDEQKTKFDFLTFWMKEKNRDNFITNTEEKNFLGLLDRMLQKMQEYYGAEWKVNFSYKIYTVTEFNRSNLPYVVKKSAVSLEEEDKGLPIHKESGLHFHKNFMIYKVKEVDVTNPSNVKKHIIVMSSYYNNFDEIDGILISGLCALVTSMYNEAAQLEIIYQFRRQNQI